MEIPSWFKAEDYLKNKLATKAVSDAGITNLPSLMVAFEKAGFAGEAGAYRHFQMYGDAEGISPNAYFNATQYLQAKAAAALGSASEYNVGRVASAIAELGMSAWDHYQKFGATEGDYGINPSNAFDQQTYLNAKAALVGKTATDVKDAITKAGMTVLQHYMQFAGQTGEVSLSTNVAVPADKQVGGTTGQTFTLTTSIDNVTGTSGNDTIIGDAGSTGAGDQINGGAGTDTLKLYGTATKSVITNVENIYLNAPAANFDASTMSGVTSLEVDSEIGAQTFTVTTGQKVILDNFTTNAITTTIAGNTPTTLDVVLNKVGTSTAAETLDFSGTALTTVNIQTTGTASINNTLTNTGTKITKLVVSGDKGLALAENVATSAAIKTIDASANTGGVKIDKVLGVANAAFAFTGGSGDDILLLRAGDPAALTAGSQIKGGEGTDKVGILDLTAALTDAVYAKIAAFDSVEVLGLNAAQAIDASKVGSIKTFSLDTDFAQSITKMATGSEVKVTAAHAATFSTSGAVGVTDLKLTIGQAASNTEAATTGLNNAGVFTIGQTNVALVSNGTNAAANQLKVANADNSVYTVTGSNDLTLTLGSAAPTAIGSKVDGSAFTGKLVVTGNTKAFATGSSLGDTLIGGSGADTLKAAINGGTLTGNAGADTFDVSVALGGTSATFNTTTITDFTKGDKIVFGATAGAFTAAKVDLSGAASVSAALDLLAAGNNSDVKWGVYNGNTYIVDDVAAGATFAATDTMVKLAGVLDLSTSTFAAGTNTLTFA